MTLFAVAGIRFRVHWLFVLLLSATAWTGRAAEGLVMFAVVLVHELAHVAAARGRGVTVREVELLPFGGVARTEGMLSADPGVEAAVAWAGPAANGVLAALGWLAGRWNAVPAGWALFFIGANGVVAAFNLLPALPLDGGRLYRAYRARQVGLRRATAEAARLGKALGAALILGGATLFALGVAAFTLPVLGAVVYTAAGREEAAAAYVFMAHLARRREALARRGCMAAVPLAARADVLLIQVLERFLPQKYYVVWIVDEGGRLVGVASESELLQALFERGPETPLKALVQERFIDRK